MAANQFFAGRDVDAEEFVGSDVGLDPLDLGAELSKYGAGGLRGGGELLLCELASVGDVAFDEKFRHFHSFAVRVWGPFFSAVELIYRLIHSSAGFVRGPSRDCQIAMLHRSGFM
jgi:hypothetical protein